MSVIRRLHPWITSTNDTFIHGWHLSIHGWHPRMTFLHPWMTFIHPWMTSTDDILPSMDDISPSMYGIFSRQVFGKNCLHHTLIEFVSNCLWVLYLQRSYKNYVVFCDSNPRLFLAWCKQFLPKTWQLKIPSIDGEISSMDESVIRGCHPWMEKCHPWMTLISVNVIHGWIHRWRRRMMDMDGALAKPRSKELKNKADQLCLCLPIP